MLTVTRGNLLKARAEALVNAVNTVGVMGKGIALQFRRAYPEMYADYQRACEAGEVQPGRMHVFQESGDECPKFIINFPTKRHWRDASQMADIESGLVALVAEVRRLKIKSIALPALGCGLGGLDWDEVRSRIEKAFAALPEVEVMLFAPGEPANHL